jgi:hypothetical protein
VALREPIDSEFKQNRKLAKQLYQQELLEKVRVNKQQHD